MKFNLLIAALAVTAALGLAAFYTNIVLSLGALLTTVA